jgi:hypothetical protein
LDIEDFNHVWTCSASHNDINNIISQAKLLLTEELQAIIPTFQGNQLTSRLDTLWDLPLFPTRNSHQFLSFIDLIKGIVPIKLSNFLLALELTQAQVVSVITKLLSFIRAASWERIWIPRCAHFQVFIRSKGITPAQQRSGPPKGSLRSIQSSPRSDPRSTSDRLSRPYATLVNDYLSYGKGYPFPWCNSFVTFLVEVFRSCVSSFSH